MSNDQSEEIQKKIAAAKEAQKIKTNDQLRPKPPENAKPRGDLSPMGTRGNEQTARTLEAQRNNSRIEQKLAEQRQRSEQLRQRGGLKKEFDRNR